MYAILKIMKVLQWTQWIVLQKLYEIKFLNIMHCMSMNPFSLCYHSLHSLVAFGNTDCHKPCFQVRKWHWLFQTQPLVTTHAPSLSVKVTASDLTDQSLGSHVPQTSGHPPLTICLWTVSVPPAVNLLSQVSTTHSSADHPGSHL